MKYEALAPDILLFTGDDHESIATAFLHEGDALLVDALGSLQDAHALHDVLCQQLGKAVRIVSATHYMSDHLAGMPLFPDAIRIAHRHHRHGFASQNVRVDDFYRDPHVVFDTALQLQWGRHELHFFHNPGRTLDHVTVDVPSADLVCTGDAIVGNIVYVSKSEPALLRSAIARIQRLQRKTVIGGHIGRFDANVLDRAQHYLAQLQAAVVHVRNHAPPEQLEAKIAALPIEACLAPGVQALPFEREWHQHNLAAIVAQQLFALDAALARREAHA